MKNLRFLLLLLLPLALISCTDTREELEIKNNGSGTLVLKSDFSKILDMMKGFTGESDLAKDGLDKPFDTTMALKDYVDTATSVPADKKELLRNGKVHLVMNVKESVGKFDMNLPFTSTDKLQQLYASLNSSSGGLKNMFDGMGKSLPKAGGEDAGGDKGMPQIASVYDITVKDGLYSRQVNKQRYEEFTKQMKLEELKQMGSMMGDMDYTLSIKLPRPAKKVSNAAMTLSDDKKTATLKTDLLKTFEHPELLAVNIEY
ncbi:MAG TPA: hypothetical protein VL307_10245 [Chitinophagaceae bacterium]|nr:hypothetical protein [Chitinophagaceae bacterium]